MHRFHWIIITYIVYSLIQLCQEINGLKCLQCNSLSDSECSLGKSKAKECSAEDYKYCITYSGASAESGTHVLFRDCGKENMTSDCQMVTVSEKKNETKPIKFRVCYRSCNTDGCNRDAHNLPHSISSLASSNVERFGTNLAVATLAVILFHIALI